MALSEQLKGKVYTITGAASGIGLATAHNLASKGADLSLADVQEQALLDTAESLRKQYGVKVLAHRVDISNDAEVDGWIQATIETLKRLDGSANIAGIFVESTATGGIMNMKNEVWNKVLDVNLTGVMYCLRAQLKAISPKGSIVNTSSVAGLMGSAQFPAYSASKHAVIGLTKCAAREAGDREVRVNVIVPGEIITPMGAAAAQLITKPGFTSARAIARPGKPEEVASLIAFLLGDESAFITGSVYQIEGGRIC